MKGADEARQQVSDEQLQRERVGRRHQLSVKTLQIPVRLVVWARRLHQRVDARRERSTAAALWS